MEGTCGAAISTVLRLGPMMNDQFRFCPPPQATPKQIIPILLEFLDNNPVALKFDIRDVYELCGPSKLALQMSLMTPQGAADTSISR
jgi:hypothetical protein